MKYNNILNNGYCEYSPELVELLTSMGYTSLSNNQPINKVVGWYGHRKEWQFLPISCGDDYTYEQLLNACKLDSYLIFN